MRSLCVADLHVRDGKSGELGVSEQLLNSIRATAKREGCKSIIMIGDVWDEKHGVNYSILTLLKKHLRWMAKDGLTIYWIRGNHEVFVKSSPEATLMELFEGIDPNIHIINKPAFFQVGDCGYFMVPWYLPDAWKGAMKQALSQRRAMGCQWNVMFSHIGLNEGRTSPSNTYTVNHNCSVSDLNYGWFDLVLLGDYHFHQWLNGNTLYLGNPIQQTHGDAERQGVWVLDTTMKPILTNVALEGTENFPVHRTYEFKDEMALRMLVEEPLNYVRIRVSQELYGMAKTLYPYLRWKFEIIQEHKTVESISRMTGIQETDFSSVLEIWLKQRGLDSVTYYRDTAMKYLMEATYEHKARGVS